MRFHLQLHGTLALDAYPRLARRAEQLGFEDVTAHDVLLRRPVWPLLCDIARATGRVAVGPDVTHPFLSHPATIAANLRHLDELSGGRAVLGIGRGSMYELVGQRPPAKALQGLEEAIELIRRLCAGETGAWSGQRFALAGGAALGFGTPRRLPVQLGVTGRRGATLAAGVADAVRTAAQWDPAWMLRVRDWVREGAELAGRDPAEVELIPENWTCVGEDRERSRSLARRVLAQFLPHLGPLLDFYRVPAEEVAAARAAAGDPAAAAAISDATVDRFVAAGDADDLRAGLDRLAGAGFDRVSFSGVLGPDPDAALQILGAELARRAPATR